MDTTLFIDIEDVDDGLICVGYAFDDGPVRVVQRAEGDLNLVLALGDPNVVKVSHSTYDAKKLRFYGFDVVGPFHDTQVMAYRLNENTPLTLEYVVKRYVHHEMDKRIRTSAGEPVFRCDDGREVHLRDAPYDQVERYNRADVEELRFLYRNLRTRLEESAWWDYFVSEDVPFTEVLLDVMCRGLPVDLEASERLREELEQFTESYQEELLEAAELPPTFNLNSGPQLSNYLFANVFELTDSLRLDPVEVECLKSCLAGEHEDCEWEGDELGPLDARVRHITEFLPDGFTIDSVGRDLVHGRWTLRGRHLPQGILTPSGDRPSTSSPALLTNLEAAQDGWVRMLLSYRKAQKVLTTYLRPMPKRVRDGRVYGRFNQTGTVTGRLSSSDPNLQNIPAHGDLGPRVRELFRADDDHILVVGDYSQLEPRLMGHFSQDPVLLDTYRNERDIYLVTASGVFGGEYDKHSTERSICKTLILALGYGAGPAKLAQILTINGHPTTESTARGYLNELQSLYGVFFRWREAVIARAKRDGYVRTIGGAHRRLAAQFKQTTWKARGYGERQAVNAIIQGSAGDVVRRAMVRIAHPEFRPLVLLGQVHDELVGEAPAWLRDADEHLLDDMRVAAELQHGFDLTVPLVFEPNWGRTWYEAKEGTTFVLPEDMATDFEDADAELEEAS